MRRRILCALTVLVVGAAIVGFSPARSAARPVLRVPVDSGRRIGCRALDRRSAELGPRYRAGPSRRDECR